MQNQPVKKNNGKINIIIIAVLVLAAAALLIVSRLSSSPNANLTQEEIDSKRSALTSESPPPQETAAAGENAAAYLFIVLNNMLYGIEPLGEERDVTIDQGNGVENVIHLLPNGYYMHSSTCDNQLCVSEGTVTIDNYNRRILGPFVLCLPHNLQLELVIPGATPDPGAPDI